MSEKTEKLEAFVKEHGVSILEKFNDVLKQNPLTSGLRISEAKISYAEEPPRKKGPTVERIEGGWIIWK